MLTSITERMGFGMANIVGSSTEVDEDVLELHTTLRNDVTGECAQEILGTIKRSSGVIAARMRQKLPPAEFHAAEQLSDALNASEKVVRHVWESMHGMRLP
jgi:hypothetical protein